MDICAYDIFDSRGTNTILVRLIDGEKVYSFSAPSGKSTGKNEVLTFPIVNGNPSSRVSVDFINKNKDLILNLFKSSSTQEDFDSKVLNLDPKFEKLGGNSTLALSSLYLKYSAGLEGKEIYEYLNKGKKTIPTPLGNCIGGGLHSNNSMAVQEVLIAHDGDSFYEKVSKNINVYHEVQSILKKEGIFFERNDEAAISAQISFMDSLSLINEASENLGYDTKIGLDAGASSYYKDGVYNFDNNVYNRLDFIRYWKNLLLRFPNIFYLEDPFDEDDFESFADLQNDVSAMIVGDDLYTTNVSLINRGIKYGSSKAIIIKPNQIGTITQTVNAVELAKKNDMTCVISHRSGETDECLISQLAVGLNIPYIKAGIIGERIIKMNELIRIERDLNDGK